MARDPSQFDQIRCLIFDLDGTLIDSKLDLALSVNATLKYIGQPALEHQTIYGYVGNGAQLLIQRALGENPDPAIVEKGLAHFLSYYREHMLDNTVAYPGVREGLDLLGRQRQSMAVLTNKPVRFSNWILEGLGMSRYFRYVYGGNSFEKKKPDPMGVEVLLRDLEAAKGEAMMVGDSDVDVRTARNSGIWACGVSYGIGTDGMRAVPPDLMVDSLIELHERLGEPGR